MAYADAMIVLYPGAIVFEVMLAAELLAAFGAVRVATASGAPHRGSNGVTIIADQSFSAAAHAPPSLLLIPGGDPGSLIGNTDIDAVVIATRQSGGALAAICAGPLLLDKAGVLAGVEIAHGYGTEQIGWLQERGHFRGCVLTDEAWRLQDRILTARPEAYVEFAVRTLQLAGLETRADVLDGLTEKYR
jgi:4-methyl-5(b-hydroxyethyl)-thiazole monophosphate biosynthesis